MCRFKEMRVPDEAGVENILQITKRGIRWSETAQVDGNSRNSCRRPLGAMPWKARELLLSIIVEAT